MYILYLYTEYKYRIYTKVFIVPCRAGIMGK